MKNGTGNGRGIHDIHSDACCTTVMCEDPASPFVIENDVQQTRIAPIQKRRARAQHECLSDRGPAVAGTCWRRRHVATARQ
jgi:hypothetical protein